MFTMQIRRKKENTTTETSRRQHAIGLHYISKLSEQVARIFKSYDITVYHKPINTLRSLLVHPKDRTAKAATPCHQPLSAISEHKLNTGHQCSMNYIKILDHENWHRKKIKEAINIHREKPTLNLDVGQELPPVLLQLVSDDIGHVTHL